MNRFTYTRPENVADAVRSIADSDTAKFIAGGTNLVDLMKSQVSRPTHLIDITRLPLHQIEETAQGGLRIGSLVSNSEVAYHKVVERRYPLLAHAILSGASAQLRNAATMGGNLLQRTRCYYFYDVGTPCNKREPGSGCSAIQGYNRNHAILGASDQCIATHPSDMCVALAALGATVQVIGKNGARSIPFSDFHRLPGETPHLDTNLLRDELITAVELPSKGFAEHFTYLKLRDRASYAFALVSIAAALELDGNTIKDARIALGGVAHKPWRDPEAESVLIGQTVSDEPFRSAAQILLRNAHGYRHNAFKIDLTGRAVVRALQQAANQQPASQHGDHAGQVAEQQS